MTGMPDPKIFDEWYKVMALAGLLFSLGSIAASNNSIFLIGLSFLLIGVGGFANHRFRTVQHYDFQGFLREGLGNPYWPTPLGGLFTLCGIIVFCIGMYKICA